MTIAWYANVRDRAWTCAPPSPDAMAFHRSLPEYSPTPLVALPQLASELGVGRVYAKDESLRLGLPAFKALGASWAIYRALAGMSHNGPVTVVTATDGNHGRAVARFAKLLGHHALIVIPDGVHPDAVQAIRDEGADVVIAGGPYDNAVTTAARLAQECEGVLVQDTAWDGYEEIPGWIVEGYATLFAEVDSQVVADGAQRPDLVLVPAGVGSLLQAALAHYRSTASRIRVVSVEPEAAACMGPSLAAGRPVSVETTVTVMSGLNCGTPSSLAWPYIVHGLDAAIAVSDAADVRAAYDLADLGVAAGPCGAAGLAAVRSVLTGPGSDVRRAHLGLDEHSVLVLIVTEGSAANPLPPRDI